MPIYDDAAKKKVVARFNEHREAGKPTTVAMEMACEELGVSSASFKRFRRELAGPNPGARPPYTEEQREAVVRRLSELRTSGMQAQEAERIVVAEGGPSIPTLRRMLAGSKREKVTSKRPGPAPKLNSEQVDQLVAWVKEQPLCTRYELTQRVKRELGIDIGEHAVSQALRSRGVVKRVLAKQYREATASTNPPVRVGYTEKHRRKAPEHEHRKGYPSDLTNEEWALLGPIVRRLDPSLTRTYNLRDIVDAIRYQNRTGCQWRYLPNDLPPHSLVHHHWQRWMRMGLFDKVNAILNEKVRLKEGRNPQPSAAILDSQSVKSVGVSESTGFDGNKKVKGRKRNLLTDVLGLILAVTISAANTHDAVAATTLVNAEFSDAFPDVKVIYADKGYRGSFQRNTDADPEQRYTIEIVGPPNQAGDRWQQCDASESVEVTNGFVVHKQRWKIERTNAWNSAQRRLRTDYERLASVTRARVFSVAASRSLARLLD